jgi:pantoate--beta-alanine ligase
MKSSIATINPMKTLETIPQLREELKAYRRLGQTIGLVPTMGYLHEGHLRLVRQSKKENDATVVSIFVNPTQFGPHEDFDRYPRKPEKDKELLKELEVEAVFYPGLKDIYPEGYATYVEVEKLGQVLCGKSRPTHFRGVTTVVLKLLNIVSPTRAYFGRKDAQQAILIKKMVRELNLEVMIKTIPIVRDPDGLALSSRNAYLSAREREEALCLSRAFKKAEREIANGCRDTAAIKKILHNEVEKHSLVKIDYLEVVSLDSLSPVHQIDPENTLVAGAIWVGKTRLIDNFILGEI